jgi:hypothetical protein
MKKSKISWVNALDVNVNNKQLDANIAHSQLYSSNTTFSLQLKNALPASLVSNSKYAL